MGDVRKFPDWERVRNVVIIPTYKEPLHVLERTLDSLGAQTLPGKQLVVVVAQEYKAPEEHRETIKNGLVKKFGRKFPNLYFTVHELTPGEVVGEASNERFAAVWVKKNLIDKRKFDIKYAVVTSCDSDHVFHPQHFVVTYKFLDNPLRYKRFWQPAVLLYNNIWKLPAITRVPNTLASIFILSMLPRRDRLINQQNYSLSFELLDRVGYWDADKIPEDWGIFFKAFFKDKGKIEVEPLYLPLYADALESTTLWRTLRGQYSCVKGMGSERLVLGHIQLFDHSGLEFLGQVFAGFDFYTRTFFMARSLVCDNRRAFVACCFESRVWKDNSWVYDTKNFFGDSYYSFDFFGDPFDS
jgi:hypothetical protein